MSSRSSCAADFTVLTVLERKGPWKTLLTNSCSHLGELALILISILWLIGAGQSMISCRAVQLLLGDSEPNLGLSHKLYLLIPWELAAGYMQWWHKWHTDMPYSHGVTNYTTISFKQCNNTFNTPWGQSQQWDGRSNTKSVNVLLSLRPKRRWRVKSLESCIRVRLYDLAINVNFTIVLFCASDLDILFRRSRLRLCSEQGGKVHVRIWIIKNRLCVEAGGNERVPYNETEE